jgi:hypothetical protein
MTPRDQERLRQLRDAVRSTANDCERFVLNERKRLELARLFLEIATSEPRTREAIRRMQVLTELRIILHAEEDERGARGIVAFIDEALAQEPQPAQAKETPR